MGSWGSTSGWNHAISYYLRIVVASAAIGLILYLLLEADQLGVATVFGLLVFFGWPLILTVLLFNEIERQTAKRLVQYHQSVFGRPPQQSLGSVSGWNHAVAYYIRVIGAIILLTVILIGLAVAEEFLLFGLFFIVSILLWPVILLALLFNESDRLMTRRLKAYDERIQPHPHQPASWGSVSGWNHAVAYYIRLFLTVLFLLFVLGILFAAELFAEGFALLFIILLLWGVIVWVLLFNENDRLISKRLSAYHERATPDQPVQQHSQQGSRKQQQADARPHANTTPAQPHNSQQPTPKQQHPQQQQPTQRQQRTHVESLEDIPLGTVSKYGVLMFWWNYFLGIFYAEFTFSDDAALDSFLYGNANSVFDVVVNMVNGVGIFAYNVHFVDIANGGSGNILRDELFRVGFLGQQAAELSVPSVVLLSLPVCIIVGFTLWLTYKSDFATPLDGAKVGAASVIVYFPLFLLGALLIEANGASPVLWMSVLAGIAYPVVFGGIGGYLGVSLRDSGDEPTGRRKRPQQRRTTHQSSGESGRRPR